MKKLFICFCLISFLSIQIFPAYGYQMIPDLLFKTGVSLYKEGRTDEALSQFKKILLIDPDFTPALEYIRKIESGGAAVVKSAPVLKRPLPVKLSPPSYPARPAAKTPEAPALVELGIQQDLTQEIVEIEQDKNIIVKGRNIKRFLVTSPNILQAEKKNADELVVTGKEVGYSYLQVWDETGRKTLEFFTAYPKPDIETLDLEMRSAEEKAQNFKLGYTFDWSLYEEGRSLTTLARSSYSYIHDLTLAGETPYGDLDSALSINRFDTKTELGHYTIGLTNGKFGPFSDFTLRGFDFFDLPPDFSNLAFPGISLRGAMLASPAFDKKINYTAFYGQENWSGFGNLSPEINKRRESYLDGLNLKYIPDPGKQEYQFTAVHGFGKDRSKDLGSMNYDLLGKFNFQDWKLKYEAANNSEAFANMLNVNYVIPKLNFGAEFRNINKKFTSSTGSSSNQGELGWLFNLYYEPKDNLSMQANFDLYRDRLYPAQDSDSRFNQDLDWGLNYRIDPSSSLRMNYSFQNDLGKLSQYRYQNGNIGLTKNIKLVKDINFYADYYHQENTNYAAHSSDYVNDRVYAGIRVNLFRPLYYYINREMNWLRESFTGNRSKPSAFETGLDWSSQLGKSPWYGSMRFTYRDEEDTLSNLSFLSGEDYIEGYSELSYRPTTDFEMYGSCRMRNVWADNPRTEKHFEASINGGMRYLWDTGISWQPVGIIDGYVFKDYNSDGIMEKNEPPVGKVKVWLGKNRSAETDILGYYIFDNVRGRRAFVNLDTATIPEGFVLTVPATQGAFIGQGQAARLNFGVASRTEIYGFVFLDINDNGIFDKDDPRIRNVVLRLEDDTIRVTDASGRYSFSSVKPGEHTIQLDLESLPVYYLPKVPLSKKITLSEGVSYPYNIPVKKNQ
ncbi:MAG: hypothetical protein FJZ15_02080 [Candidatus Omnitrophica bacterium]|nr:hypothetical protein [Candidatus Omnitrophota bacterium]